MEINLVDHLTIPVSSLKQIEYRKKYFHDLKAYGAWEHIERYYSVINEGSTYRDLLKCWCITADK